MSRRSSALTPLAIVLPHPPLPHRRSSLLSLNSAASPHTPRSCHSPVALPIYYPANRNSTDSWNSSNADDMDVEWKQEHVSLLSRTLDALPAHLVTPFNGPVPPSNLLDKIARGVSQAKGPADWPYSIRATRIKLLELARTRAKEEALADQRRHAHAHPIVEEELYDIDVQITDPSAYPVDNDVNEEEDMDVQMHSSYYLNGEEKKPLPLPSSLPRKPLYRQSSMDFIKPGIADLKDNPAIARLSSRLQRTDRIITTPSYHPYSRGAPAPASVSVSVSRTAGGSSRPPHTQNPKNNNKAKHNRKRSTSPPHPTDVPGLIDPSTSSSSSSSSATPSSTTLNSLSFSSLESAPRILRRSGSTLSSGSLLSVSASSVNGKGDHNNNAPAPLSDPRIQRVRRSDSQTFSASFRSSTFSTTSSASASSLSSYSGLPPVPPPKDFPVFFYQQQQEQKESQKQCVTNANAKVNAKANAKTHTHTRTQTQTQARAGFKRAPSYGALAQEARLEAKQQQQRHQATSTTTTTSTTTPNNSTATPSLSKHQQQQKELSKAGSGTVGPAAATGTGTGPATNTTATTNANAHTRNLSSGSYPSSDEEEKARTTRAKKMKMRNVSGGGVDTMIPTTPTAAEASPPPSSVPSSPAQSDVLGSPMSIPRTPTGAGAGVKVKTKVNKEASTRIGNGNVNASKPAGISLVNKGLEVKVKGKTGKMENGKDNKTRKVDKGGDKDKEMMMNVSPSTTTTTHNGNAKEEISPLPRKRRAPMTTHSSIPIPMNPQRNPSMFGIELVNVQPMPTKGRPSSPSVRARVVPEKGLSSPLPVPAPAPTPTSVQNISSAATAVNATPPPPTRIHVLGTSTRRNLRSGSAGAGGENALGITPQLQQIQVKTRAAPLSPSLADALGFGLSSSEERERERAMATSPTLDHTLVPTAPSSPVVGYKQGRGHRHMSSTSTCASVSASASVSPSLAPSSPVSLSLSPSAPNPLTLSPSSPTKIRTLRRVRRLLAPARRISFGSLVAPPPSGAGAESVGEGAGEEGDSMDVSGYGYGQREREGFGGGKIGLGMGLGLGSAFQLH